MGIVFHLITVTLDWEDVLRPANTIGYHGEYSKTCLLKHLKGVASHGIPFT